MISILSKIQCEHIKKYFSYNSDTGVIARTDRKNSNGRLNKDGYLVIKIKKQAFLAHRLAWYLYYGELPEMEIDHINRQRADNRIKNLRLATRRTNNLNTNRINKDTGERGVYLDKSTKGLLSKYTIKLNGKTYRFRSLEEAKQKRQELLKDVYNDNTRSLKYYTSRA